MWYNTDFGTKNADDENGFSYEIIEESDKTIMLLVSSKDEDYEGEKIGPFGPFQTVKEAEEFASFISEIP